MQKRATEVLQKRNLSRREEQALLEIFMEVADQCDGDNFGPDGMLNINKTYQEQSKALRKLYGELIA
jgi:hypothetical protein